MCLILLLVLEESIVIGGVPLIDESLININSGTGID
jgi:hypothetical protein